MTRWYEDPWARRRYLAVAVVTAVVVAGAGWLWWSQAWRDVGEVGEASELGSAVRDAASYGRTSDEIEVALPSGPITLTVGEPTDSLPNRVRLEDEGEPDAGVRYAPRGAEFLPLSWARTGPAPRSAGVFFRDVDAPEVAEVGEPTLTVTDESTGAVLAGPFDLDESRPGGPDTAAVAVLVDDAADVRVAVTFDGHTQTVDPLGGEVAAGVAAPYYDAPPAQFPAGAAPTADCQLSETTAGAGFRGLDVTEPEWSCEVFGVVRAPWAPGLGWVEEPGRQWLSVTMDVTVPAFVDREPVAGGVEGSYEVTADGAPSIALADVAPSAAERMDETLPTPSPGWDGATWPVADGPVADDVTAEVPLRLVPITTGARPSEVTVTAVVDLDGL